MRLKYFFLFSYYPPIDLIVILYYNMYYNKHNVLYSLKQKYKEKSIYKICIIIIYCLIPDNFMNLYGGTEFMDRRQRKTREAIFRAFTDLLSKKDFENITVGDIAERADIGRATFYSHFETKDFLLRELCGELFCHIFDVMYERNEHKHIFECDTADSVILHLFRHLQQNDNNILELLSRDNNELFLRYFKNNLAGLIENQMYLFKTEKNKKLPDSFLVNHISSTFVEAIRWWVNNGKKESPETMSEYFFLVL